MSMVGIVILKAVGASLSMKWNPGLIPWIFKSSVNYANACIISFSLLFFINAVRRALQSYTYMTYMYLFTLLDVVGKGLHRSE